METNQAEGAVFQTASATGPTITARDASPVETAAAAINNNLDRIAGMLSKLEDRLGSALNPQPMDYPGRIEDRTGTVVSPLAGLLEEHAIRADEIADRIGRITARVEL